MISIEPNKTLKGEHDMIAVGSKLLFKFKPPFSDRYQGDRIYLISSVEEYSSFRAVGDLADVYTGVTNWETKLISDETAGMKIATMIDEGGTQIFVPTGYFWPTEGNGLVPWSEQTIVVSINAWPRDHDHTDIREAIESAVVNMLGVVPAIALVETSRPANFSADDSDVMLATRRTRHDSMYDSSHSLRKRLELCKSTVLSLEEYISNCLP